MNEVKLPTADFYGSTAVPEDTPLYTADQMQAYALAAALSAQPQEASPADELLRATRELCQQAAKTPGQPVAIPENIKREWEKFMAEEASLFDQMPFGEIKKLGTITSTLAAHPPSAQVEKHPPWCSGGCCNPEDKAAQGERDFSNYELTVLGTAVGALNFTKFEALFRKIEAILAARASAGNQK